jgi:hypothetical protein
MYVSWRRAHRAMPEKATQCLPAGEVVPLNA